MTIARILEPRLRRAARQLPVVAVTGPRQSGKTTVCRACFPGHDYVSLEPLDVREFAETDPRGFLAQYPGPVVLDEVQRVPGLFSYLHETVDEDPQPGRFVLTGSQRFGLTEAISQSLAGRAAMLNLLPMSLEETRRFPAQTGQRPADLWTTVWTGGYPRIHDRRLPPAEWLNDYADTYVQRDVRQAVQVTNLAAFSTFLRLAAGRTAQELNLSSLGADAGVTHPTVRAWLSVLEASFVVFRVPPWIRNLRKRLVKAPKLYFHDVGLASRLLGIESVRQIGTHPLRGALFENAVVAEALKHGHHRGRRPELSFFRDSRGLECDLLYPSEGRVLAIEAKSGATIASDWFTGLERAAALIPGCAAGAVVHGGNDRRTRAAGEALPLTDLSALLARFDRGP